ncbi:MAG: Eco57I restriction-modification methylase domain-containing protein [Brevinema sp.]
MKPNILTNSEFLNSDLINKNLHTNDIKEKLSYYLTHIEKAKKEAIIDEQEHEEHFKNILNQFFSDVYGYKNNTHQRIDSVIRQDDRLRVIIEVKRPKNQDEMVQIDDFNRKAFHEALLYYYELKQQNIYSINYILITDCEKIYLISSKHFEDLIKNKTIAPILEDFKSKSNNVIKKTNDLYNALKSILKDMPIKISCYFVDLKDPNIDLDILYKLFSEYSLFKTVLDNDANELNRPFYDELLYVMGLQEKEDKIIKNNVKNTLLDLTEQMIGKDHKGEELFEVSLGLNILWLNRVLFLKILESQLKVFRNDPKFAILDPESITGYHLLAKLFFNILSTPRDKRHEDDHKYDLIPYLNSSLFEETTLEKSYRIRDLDIERKVKIKDNSVLYNDKNFKQKELTLLEYLLRFLNCFSYNSDHSSEDTVIKSSVLGLVFEKLNGYKDGSHFTPASITMYMSQKIIQKRVLDKFNQEFKQSFNNFAELKEFRFIKEELIQARSIIDRISICDPAVGSGHFLVSCLNELIRIKSELGLLHKDIKIDIVNDELIIKSVFGKRFIYQISNNAITTEEKEIQQAIFHTKKYIIENQLYGIDINPNSVNICRLRLWIELLKHTYYTDESYVNLEVLPNLEFKVMTANSLIAVRDIPLYFNKDHRAKLSEAMRTYYNARLSEKNEIKAQVQELIGNVKSRIDQLKNYNPFDTVLSCSFFDSGLMFGIERFDIVIGNPPYVSNKGISSEMMTKYKAEYGEQDDLYNYFYRRGFDLVVEGGILGYITSNTFLTIQSKQKLRQFLQSKHLLEMRLVDNIFESVAVEPIVLIAKNDELNDYSFSYIDNRFNTDLLSNENAIIVPISVYKNAPNQVFFTPTENNLELATRYFGTIQGLITTYWDVIKTSANIEKNRKFLDLYRSNLKAGDVSLLGLLTDGGQGLATANNGYFVGVRAGTKDAERTYTQRLDKIAKFNKEYKTDHSISSLTEQEIRILFTDLKAQYGRDVFGQGFLYQIISDDELADVTTLSELEKSEGIVGKRSFVPYDKGDKDGNRWYMPTVYAINWSQENVKFLKGNSGKKGQGMPVVRNPQFYFKEGFCWNLINGDKNTNDLKVKLKESSINDVGGMALYPINISLKYLIVTLNADFINKYTEQFINFTVNFQINDMRQVPIIIPTPAQLKVAEELFDRAKTIQEQQIAKLLSKLETDKLLEEIQIEVDEFVRGLYRGVR